MIHIGQIIAEEMQKRGCTKAWLAKQLYCHPTNIGKLLKRQSVDTEQLLKISKIMGINFFEYYAQEFMQEKISVKQENYSISK